LSILYSSRKQSGKLKTEAVFNFNRKGSCFWKLQNLWNHKIDFGFMSVALLEFLNSATL